MPNNKRQFNKEPDKKQKKKHSDSSQKNLVSLRLSDDERQSLERIAKSSSKSYPEILREAIAQWIAKRRRLCLDS
ncbi:MAG: ribbon-helix-helix protein, CopG family [Deltaproteobacteria bacterium]|nr:ribbon-helix-helix protein, CopG family [Deltaproteobacteria bacterium]TLN01373.1 MAG: ribbon-helix-helix protein, CopG family [bacterium]